MSLDFSYNAWANRTIVDAMRRWENRPPAADRVLAHLALATETWLARLLGTSAATNIWEELPLDVAVERLFAADAGLLAGGWPAEGTLHYRTTQGAAMADDIDDVIAHVLNHGTYHRGQIAGLMLANDVEPPFTDFIWFLRSP